MGASGKPAAPCETEQRSLAPDDLQGFKQLLASFSLGLGPKFSKKLRPSQDQIATRLVENKKREKAVRNDME